MKTESMIVRATRTLEDSKNLITSMRVNDNLSNEVRYITRDLAKTNSSLYNATSEINALEKKAYDRKQTIRVMYWFIAGLLAIIILL